MMHTSLLRGARTTEAYHTILRYHQQKLNCPFCGYALQRSALLNILLAAQTAARKGLVPSLLTKDLHEDISTWAEAVFPDGLKGLERATPEEVFLLIQSLQQNKGEQSDLFLVHRLDQAHVCDPQWHSHQEIRFQARDLHQNLRGQQEQNTSVEDSRVPLLALLRAICTTLDIPIPDEARPKSPFPASISTLEEHGEQEHGERHESQQEDAFPATARVSSGDTEYVPV